jgi:DnaK suppressor protein
MARYEDLTRSLTARLQEMRGRVNKIETDMSAPEDADLSEQAVMDEDKEQLAALDEVGIAEINAINATLGRIENNTFGICTNCGVAVSAARLEALPTAALCIKCANDADRLHHRV